MIAIACDHAAFEVKNQLIAFLEQKGYQIADKGCFSSDSVDYPDLALAACKEVSAQNADKAILLCGTGIGMSIAANKIKGIRCGLCRSTFEAEMTRQHNNANVLAVGARVSCFEDIKAIALTFLSTEFSNESRHQQRLDKIASIENKNFK
jgi:ribose 5-phosphate isomerase B